MINFDKELLQLVDGLPKEFGAVRDKYKAKNALKFLLIFQDTPENWSVRWSIGKALHLFTEIDIFFTEGSSGRIDASLAYTIPEEIIRKETATYFLWKLYLSPVEYAHIMSGASFKTIRIYGVEDKNLYRKAKKLLSNQIKFLPHQIKRAEAIVKNIKKKMDDTKVSLAALTCGGDLPDLVSERLEKERVSYAVIRPRIYYPSDLDLYKARMTGIIPSYEEIIGDLSEPPVIPIKIDVNAPHIKKESMKEQCRKNLVELIENQQLPLIIKDISSSRKYEKFKRILNSKENGPKTKAVLIKAELLSIPQGISYLEKIIGFDNGVMRRDAAIGDKIATAQIEKTTETFLDIEHFERALGQAHGRDRDQIQKSLSVFYNCAIENMNRFIEEFNKIEQPKTKAVDHVLKELAKKSRSSKGLTNWVFPHLSLHICGLCGTKKYSDEESWHTFEKGKRKAILCSNCANTFQDAMKQIQTIKIEDHDLKPLHAAYGDLLRVLELDKNNQSAQKLMEDIKQLYDELGDSLPSKAVAQKAADSIRKKTFGMQAKKAWTGQAAKKNQRFSADIGQPRNVILAMLTVTVFAALAFVGAYEIHQLVTKFVVEWVPGEFMGLIPLSLLLAAFYFFKYFWQKIGRRQWKKKTAFQKFVEIGLYSAVIAIMGYVFTAENGWVRLGATRMIIVSTPWFEKMKSAKVKLSSEEKSAQKGKKSQSISGQVKQSEPIVKQMRESEKRKEKIKHFKPLEIPTILQKPARADAKGPNTNPSKSIIYKVRSGDTLSAICRRHGIPLKELCRINDIKANDVIVPGQELIVKNSGS